MEKVSGKAPCHLYLCCPSLVKVCICSKLLYQPYCTQNGQNSILWSSGCSECSRVKHSEFSRVKGKNVSVRADPTEWGISYKVTNTKPKILSIFVKMAENTCKPNVRIISHFSDTCMHNCLKPCSNGTK